MQNSDSSIKCLTYNIQLGFKANQDPWNVENIGATYEQIENIAGIINKFKPDIITLQEVPRNRSNTEIKNFIEVLANRLKMNYAFGAHGYNDADGVYPMSGEWGNAILSNYEIIEINNTEISHIDKWQKRSILDAKLALNDSTYIHVISLHFGNGLSEYNEGISNTKSYINELNSPTILMGDFNPQFGSVVLGEDLETIGLVDSDTTLIFGVDRIFYTEKRFSTLMVESYYDTINWTSDHPANYCELKFINYSH